MDRDLFLHYFNYKVNLTEIDTELLEGQFKVIDKEEVFENRRLLRAFLSNAATKGYLIVLVLLSFLFVLRYITKEYLESTSIVPYAIVVILGYFSIHGLYFLKKYEFSSSQYAAQQKVENNYKHMIMDNENTFLFKHEQSKSGFGLPLRKKQEEPKIKKWDIYDPDWDLLDFILNIFPWDLLRFVVFIFYISVAVTLFRQPGDSLFHSFGLVMGVLILVFSGTFCIVIAVSFLRELKYIVKKIFNYHNIKSRLYNQYTDELDDIEFTFEQCIADYHSGEISFDEFKQFQTDYINARTLFTQYKTTLNELPFIPNRRYNLWIIFGSPVIAFLFSSFQPLISNWLGALIPF